MMELLFRDKVLVYLKNIESPAIFDFDLREWISQSNKIIPFKHHCSTFHISFTCIKRPPAFRDHVLTPSSGL